MLTTLVISSSCELAAGDELVADRVRDLAHDLELVEARGQQVEREDDRSLEGVLDGHDAELGVALGDGDEHVLDRGIRERGEVAVRCAGQQGLFGEGALGAKERDSAGLVSPLCFSSRRVGW